MKYTLRCSPLTTLMIAVGDVLFGVRRDALGAPLVGDDEGAVLLDLVLPRNGLLLVGIDVLGRHLLRGVLVTLESIPERLEVGVLREDHDVQRRIELLENVAGSGPTG